LSLASASGQAAYVAGSSSVVSVDESSVSHIPGVRVLRRGDTDQPNLGAGEALHPAPPAAIANAFFDATGVRIREAPLTPARVRAALRTAGVA
jgi:hypothetical protein